MASTIARVTGGQIDGHLDQDVIAFKGIPFAAPPVKDNRWRAPQPVVPWQSVRHAIDYWSDCGRSPFRETPHRWVSRRPKTAST